jgi:multidrug efflux pump subunit AcrA (membrane-fusion protein)
MDKSVLDESAAPVSSQSSEIKAKGSAKNSSVRIGLLVALVALSAGLAFGLPHLFGGKKDVAASGRGEKGAANRPVPVTTAVAKAGTLPVEVRTIGNVLPYSVVNVTPQVSGQLLK